MNSSVVLIFMALNFLHRFRWAEEAIHCFHSCGGIIESIFKCVIYASFGCRLFFFFSIPHGLGVLLAVPFFQKLSYPLGGSNDVKDPALQAEVLEHWKTPTDTILVLSGCLGRKEGVSDCCCPIIILPWGWWVFFSGRQQVSLPSSLNMSESREWGLRKEVVHSTWIRAAPSKKTFCAYSCYWNHKVGWECGDGNGKLQSLGLLYLGKS